MAIRRIHREDPDFYRVMGPVFGSRSIERATHDRFYDDPGKIWYVSERAVASVLRHEIRNFYAKDRVAARALIEALLIDYPDLTGVVPNTHRESFLAYGFSVHDRSKNFIDIAYER